MSISRRHFLGGAAAAILSGGYARAQAETGEVSIDALDMAAAEPVFKRERFPSPVIIESLRLLHREGEYFVHIRSRDGAEGISLTNFHVEHLQPILLKRVFPFFINKDARDIEELLFGVYRHNDNYKYQGLALWCPVAWVEFALLDMLGRIANASIGELLGGVVRREMPYYVASGRRDTTPEQEADYLQALVNRTGAKAVKFRVGGRMSRNEDASPGRTEALIPLARKALGDKIDLHADANSSYDPSKAIEVGRMLEEVNAVYFEEPSPFDHLDDTKLVADALTIPVAGGEQESSERRFRWMIANRGVDIVQPDLQYYGGLIRSKRVANMADVAGMPTTVHISGGFGFVYMLHFASCTRDIGKYQEYKEGIGRYADWFSPKLVVNDGAMTVPSGPGVGIENPGELIKDAMSIES